MGLGTIVTALTLAWAFSLLVHVAHGQDIKTKLDSVRQSERTPGLLLTSIPSNRTENTTVIGVRKYGQDTAMRESDSLHLGSLTKAMTATLVAKLIEGGNLTWNTTIQDVFQGSDFDISSAYQSITVERLCSHRSGLTNDTLLGDPGFFNSLRAQTDVVKGRAAYLARALSATPAQPSDQYLYSNINYIVLGHMIDRLSGPWETVVRSQLFDRLGMRDCGFGPAPESSSTAIDNPWPHNVTSGLQPEPVSSDLDNPLFLGPAGVLHCTSSAYARFIRLHLQALIDPASNETSFLRPETWKRLHSPYDSNARDSTLYTPGGWMYEQDSSGGTTLWHTGSNGVNYAIVYLFTSERSAAFSFANVGPPNGLEAARKAIESYRGSDGGRTSTGKASKKAIFSRLCWLGLLTSMLL